MPHEALTPVGTFGWFAMLIIHAIRSKRYAELFIPIVFGMGIIDAWAVAPAALRRDHQGSGVLQIDCRDRERSNRRRHQRL